MKKSLRILAMTLALSAAASMAGCSGSPSSSVSPNPSSSSPSPASNVNSSSQAPVESAGPNKVTMLNNFYATDPPKTDSVIFERISQHTNTELEITWVPYAAYNEKFNALLAAGDLPQIVLNNEGKKAGIINAVRSGMFWEIGPEIQNYPNLSQLNSKVFDTLAVDGKVYALFRQRVLARNGYIIRKDWLDKLGLEMPKTIDEVYKVAEAFTTMDPDGNGIADTFGVAESSNFQVREVSVWCGSQTGNFMKDGKMYPEFFHDGYLAALDFYRNLYANDYINKDFPVVKQRGDNINNGKAGIYFGVIDDVNTKFNDLYKLNPEAELDVMQPLYTPDGIPVVRATSGYNGLFYFSKTSIPDEAQLQVCLRFMDQLGDDEICDLINFGIEGDHYTLKDGKAIRTPEQISAFNVLQNDISQISPFGSMRKHLVGGDVTPIAEKVETLFAQNEQYAITDIGAPFLSDTAIKMGDELNQIYKDAQVKYVLGEIDLDGWNQAKEEWLKAGGDKVIEEYTQQYSEFNK